MMASRAALGTIPVNTERNATVDAKSRRKTLAGPASSSLSGRPSLGGAQRRKSAVRNSLSRMSIGGRQSIGRRTSVMPTRKGGSGSKQDPRPLNDKQYMMSNIKTLIRFLTEHGYDRSLSPKLLTSPTSKDFYCIVEFLYRQIDPNYTMDKKYEEAIPAIFKQLGYPFPISKTALYAVGSPHTWPALLGALSWLVELITYEEIIEEKEAEAVNNLQEENPEKLFFNYLTVSYGTFMAGDDDNIEKLDFELQEQFARRNANVANAIAALENEAAQCHTALQKILDSPTSLDNLTARRNTVASDLQKFRKLIDDLEAHRAAVDQKTAQMTTELASKEREIEAVRGEIEQLNARLATQKLRPADVERLQSERMSLERTVRALADERAQVEAAAADKAASIGQTREAVDAALAAYHADARRLALIPSNAANARGRCFTISFASDESDVNDTGVPRVLSVDIKGSIVPALEATLEELREAVLGDQSQLLELSAKKERVAEERADNEADLERLRHRLKKMENAYVVEKQRADTELRTIESEIEQIQSEIELAKDATVNGLERATAAVTEKKQHYAALLAQCNDEKVALAGVMAEMARVVAAHKEFVSDALDDTLDVLEREIAEAANPPVNQ